jgi:hypothetical protein
MPLTVRTGAFLWPVAELPGPPERAGTPGKKRTHNPHHKHVLAHDSPSVYLWGGGDGPPTRTQARSRTVRPLAVSTRDRNLASTNVMALVMRPTSATADRNDCEGADTGEDGRSSRVAPPSTSPYVGQNNRGTSSSGKRKRRRHIAEGPWAQTNGGPVLTHQKLVIRLSSGCSDSSTFLIQPTRHNSKSAAHTQHRRERTPSAAPRQGRPQTRRVKSMNGMHWQSRLGPPYPLAPTYSARICAMSRSHSRAFCSCSFTRAAWATRSACCRSHKPCSSSTVAMRPWWR